jgi:hypothetical protein
MHDSVPTTTHAAASELADGAPYRLMPAPMLRGAGAAQAKTRSRLNSLNIRAWEWRKPTFYSQPSG